MNAKVRAWHYSSLSRRGVTVLFTLIFVSAAGFTPIAARAGIISFMPGDAFFHTELTEKVVDSLSANPNMIDLAYAYPPDSGSLAGYAGFTKIRVQNSTKELCGHLRDCYRHLRKSREKVVRITEHDCIRSDVEINGLSLFVYNKDTKWDVQRLGLKYNESWPKLPKEALEGTRKMSAPGEAAIIYDPFIRKYEAVVEDWENAAQFPGLQATVKSRTAWGILGPAIDEPVIVDASLIEFIVVPGNDLFEWFQRKPDHFILRITASGIERLSWKKRELERVPWKFED